MTLTVRFLGTSASRPTIERSVSATALVRDGDTLLFDCGEGTQRQMMRYGVSFALNHIFFSHFHADHFLGLLGLVRTMSLQGRTDPLHLYGPKGADRLLQRAVSLGYDRLTFPLVIVDLGAGEEVSFGDYLVRAVAAEHNGPPSLAFAVIEPPRRGRFSPDIARQLGIPEGPLWGRIHKGETITLADGRTIEPSQLVGPTRVGRHVVISGDTRPCASIEEAAQGADLLVHEATFANEEAARAEETGHSTAEGAAQLAARAGVRRLVLTHLSSRYSRETDTLAAEARAFFPQVIIARDGLELEVPFADTETDATTPVSAGEDS